MTTNDKLDTTQNPYTAPRASLDSDDTDKVVLATRGRRLGAVLLDSLILVLACFIVTVPIVLLFPGGTDALDKFITENYIEANPDLLGLGLLNPVVYVEIFVTIVVYFGVNGYFLATRGQSLGKMILRIKIVDADTHQVVPLTKIIAMRYFIFDAINLLNVVLAMIVSLVDIFSIFRRDRRMIHDLTANTVVIKV